MSKSYALIKLHYRKAKPGEVKCSGCKFVHAYDQYSSARRGLCCFGLESPNDIPVVGAKNTCDKAARP